MMSYLYKYIGASLFVAAILFCIGGIPVYAKDPKPTIKDPSYAAQFVSQSVKDPITMEAGSKQTVTITFKNSGTATWYKKGGKHLSAYTEVPRHRLSAFAGANWISKEQTAIIEPAEIPPGKQGTLTIQLEVPTTPGTYIEEFHLAAENTTWVKGGYFFLKIIVTENKEVKKETNTTPKEDNTVTTVSTTIPALSAKRTILNKKKIQAKGGEEISIVLGLRNDGQEAWKQYGLVANIPSGVATDDTLTFADDSWEHHSLILKKKKVIAPQKTVRETFTFRTPTKKGNYTFVIAAMVNDTILKKEVATIDVTVTSDAPSHYDAPVFDTRVPLYTPNEPRLEEEPHIRVGLWKEPKEDVQFRPLDDDYIIYDGTKEMGILPMKQLATFSYNEKTKEFTYTSDDVLFTTNEYIRLAPKTNKHATFLLLNYKHRVSWRGSLNFNKYHGSIEYRKTDDNTSRYIINDLVFEDYVSGIAEASDASPMEFLKAQAVAARTYAYYVSTFTNKHEKRFFDVVAHTGDQLYLGVNNEELTPRYTEATNSTRGQMITYNNDIVITPYFGNSNGKTKSWTSVWGGGEKPWLVPVVAEYDAGRSLYGHGVGMSQRDAAIRANKEGSTFEQLLKHYYTGIEIERIYR